MEKDMNFFEEVDLQSRLARKNAKHSRLSAPLNFKTGLLIGGVSVASILAIAGFQNNSNSYSFEETALHLDSVQIQQNNRIIELLEKGARKDTTIVHIIAPVL